MKINDNIEIKQGECTELLENLEDNSVNAIVTDPPYLYLKNQKLDIPFNEEKFFTEAKRILKDDGFIVMFGRGTAFYRWNTILANLGFTFKEEIVWDKIQTSSPILSLNRIHETVSIHIKKKGKINKVRIPYLEMKGHDIGAIKQDIERLMSVFSNEKHFKAVYDYLENNKEIFDLDCGKHFISYQNKIKSCFRCVTMTKQIKEGQREKSIIHENRDHYKMKHPTQKPVRLMERLIALVTQDKDLVVDPFMGSASTGIACLNTGRKFIGFEIDDEYFNIAKTRVEEALKKNTQAIC